MKINKYNNLLAYSLKNEYVDVYIIPDLGGKIAKIEYNDGFNPVFTKEYDDYTLPNEPDFAKYDTSGIDDCLPTIDLCEYNGNVLPDHGEIWFNKMTVIEEDDKHIKLSYDLKSIPITFIKEISIDKNEINISYTVRASEDTHYLWAFHGLMSLDGCMYIHEPDNTGIVQVDGDTMPLDYCNIKDYKENKTYKFYYKDKLKEGKITLEYAHHNLHYQFDHNSTPYLGVWITTGGFKGEKNIAIEPCNGYYDSLVKAIENNKVVKIAKDETHSWYVKLLIERK